MFKSIGGLYMNGILVYANKRGHAKKTASTLAKMLNLPVYSVEENPDLTEVDCLCLVGELQNGEAMPQMVTYVSKLKSSAVKMAAIITCSAHTDSSQTMVKTLLTQKNIEVNGESVCMCQEMLIFGLGHPNRSDFDRCERYLKGVLGIPLY